MVRMIGEKIGDFLVIVAALQRVLRGRRVRMSFVVNIQLNSNGTE
jgi:hypothetical protein